VLELKVELQRLSQAPDVPGARKGV